MENLENKLHRTCGLEVRERLSEAPFRDARSPGPRGDAKGKNH